MGRDWKSNTRPNRRPRRSRTSRGRPDAEGRIQSRSWDDKETGQKRYTTEILVNNMVRLGRAGEGGGGGDFPPSEGDFSQDQPATSGAAKGGSYTDEDDDLPF